MSRPDLMGLAAEERRDLADFLDTLEPEQWEAATLCAGWSVREVVAHVVSYDELSRPGLALRYGKGLFRKGGANTVGVMEYRDRSPADLIAVLRAHLTPRGLTAAFGGSIALTDGTIHHQDIRRSLGMPRTVPSERVRHVLPIAIKAPPLPSRRDVRGLRLAATDLDWSHGDGPEVTGTGEALMMAIAGRSAVLPELNGPGVATLADRMRRRLA